MKLLHENVIRVLGLFSILMCIIVAVSRSYLAVLIALEPKSRWGTFFEVVPDFPDVDPFTGGGVVVKGLFYAAIVLLILITSTFIRYQLRWILPCMLSVIWIFFSVAMFSNVGQLIKPAGYCFFILLTLSCSAFSVILVVNFVKKGTP